MPVGVLDADGRAAAVTRVGRVGAEQQVDGLADLVELDLEVDGRGGALDAGVLVLEHERPGSPAVAHGRVARCELPASRYRSCHSA